MADFHLSDNAKELHSQLSSSQIKRVQGKLHPLLEALHERSSTYITDLRQALSRS